MTSKVIEEWLAKSRALAPSQKRFLEKALAWYEEFAAEAGDDPATRTGVANAHYRAGYILKSLGRHGDASAAYQRAEEWYRPSGMTRARQQLAATLAAQAVLMYDQRTPADGDRLMEAAVASTTGCGRAAGRFPPQRPGRRAGPVV